jgi:hypothetical protein
MEVHLFSANLILKLSDYLGTRDVYNIGGVSRTARSKIRKNTTLWKAVVARRCPCELWSQVSLDDDDYVIIAIQEEEDLGRALRRYHVLYRLDQPMSSRDALRVYLEITTPGLPAPHDKVIIPGTLLSPGGEIIPDKVPSVPAEGVDSPAGVVGQNGEKRKPKRKHPQIIFKRNDGKAFHIWDERDNFRSQHRYYTIDRRNPQPGNLDSSVAKFRECMVWGRDGLQSRAKTILSKEDYTFINGVLKLDIPKEDKGKIVKQRGGSGGNGEKNAVAIGGAEIQAGAVMGGDAAGVRDAAGPREIDPRDLLLGNMFRLLPSRASDPQVSAYTSWTIEVDFEGWFQVLHFANPLFDSKTGVGLSKSTDSLEGSGS